MGTTTTNTGNLNEDEGEIHVTVDRRGVILDLPEEASVASLLRARGTAVDTRATRPSPAYAHASLPSIPPPFWHRLRFGAKPAAD